jgi:hypothetical protein
MLKALALFFSCLLFIPAHASKPTFSENKAFYMAKFTQDAYWQKRWWLEKTMRLLRGGQGLTGEDNVDEWMALSEEEIVHKLIQDERFGDMTLDFNMYFLGFKLDALKSGTTYSEQIYGFPSAVDSAREVMSGGDYFQLLDLVTSPTLGKVQVFRRSGEENMTDEQIFDARSARIQKELQEIIQYAETDGSATVKSVCEKAVVHSQQFGLRFIDLDLPLQLVFMMQIDSGWYGSLRPACQFNFQTELPQIVGFLKNIHAINERLISQVKNFVVGDYDPHNVRDLRTLDVKQIGFNDPWLSYGLDQRIALQNSSTNRNRKRGAYALKHYFCDDLTPIGVEDPKEHTGGAHGSDPACYSCHYKLDPMAGFFRYHGTVFFDFTKFNFMIFDDEATVPLEPYVDNWKAPDGSTRAWNVGYVRSPSDESFNDYGDTLEDLHSLLRRAPEVKRCLTKRMFEYLVSEGQTMEGSFLRDVSAEFANKAETNSSEAFKWLVGKVALSQSFRQADIDPNQCYDFGEGYDADHAPPCRVASLIKENCGTCHQTTAGYGNLDLTSWVTFEDGSQGFPHLDEYGVQVPMHTTFERIADRLSTGDATRRMPYAKYMSSQERQELYLWIQEKL